MTRNDAFPDGKWGFVPRSEIEGRIARLQAALNQAGIDLALVVQNADMCLGVQELIKGAARVGAACGEVYKQANEWMARQLASAGLTAYFMGAPNNQAPYVGHGVGLELDELPVVARGFKMLLERDQVIACEPKLVFPGRGVVGVENTWRVTEHGLERPTVSSDALLEL